MVLLSAALSHGVLAYTLVTIVSSEVWDIIGIDRIVLSLYANTLCRLKHTLITDAAVSGESP